MRKTLAGYLTFPILVNPDNDQHMTPAKVYLKFKKDESLEDAQDGNWQFANGHKVRISIYSVEVLDEEGGETRTIEGTPAELKRYAFVAGQPRGPEAPGENRGAKRDDRQRRDRAAGLCLRWPRLGQGNHYLRSGQRFDRTQGVNQMKNKIAQKLGKILEQSRVSVILPILTCSLVSISPSIAQTVAYSDNLYRHQTVAASCQPALQNGNGQEFIHWAIGATPISLTRMMAQK